MKKKILTLFVLLAIATGFVQAQQAQQTTDSTSEKEIEVCFNAKRDVFIFPGNDNEANFVTRSSMVDEQPQTAEQSKQELQLLQVTVAGESTGVATLQRKPSSWYMGFGGSVSFGRSTFASFAMTEIRPGFNMGVLGGYKINKLLSAEVSLDYTRMKLGTYDCCQNLWLGKDGNRYFAPLTGVKSYKYSDLTSTTNLAGLGAHLTIDLLSIWNEDSKWSALVSPAIYVVYSNAGVKQLGTKVHKASTLHFGSGLDLGVGYMITSKIGLRLSTGINFLTGAIDALPSEEHKTSYVWNSGLKLIYKL